MHLQFTEHAKQYDWKDSKRWIQTWFSNALQSCALQFHEKIVGYLSYKMFKRKKLGQSLK